MEIYVTVRAGDGIANILCQGIQKDELVDGNIVLIGCHNFSLNVDENTRSIFKDLKGPFQYK